MEKKMTFKDHLERIESKGYSICDFCNACVKDECHWWLRNYGGRPFDMCKAGVDKEGIELLSWELGDD